MDTCTLLFVDDEKNILSALRRVFDETDYEILTAEDGRQGLRLMKDHDVSLILSDYRMPGLNGIEFLKQAREISPFATRMILTGYADMDVILSAINEGNVFKFILKPWEEANLKLEIQKGLEYFSMKKQQDELVKTVEEQNRRLKEWNVTLEKKVDEKTKEIKEMNNILKQNIRELESRDKVLEFLLDVHTLEESLEAILNEIMALIPVHKLVAYVLAPDRKSMKPKFGITRKGKGTTTLSSKELKRCPTLPLPTPDDQDKQYYDGLSEANRLSEYSIFIPFKRQHNCLGSLLLDNMETKTPLQESGIKLASVFASLAAIAVNDYLVTVTSTDIEKTIQEILQ